LCTKPNIFVLIFWIFTIYVLRAFSAIITVQIASFYMHNHVQIVNFSIILDFTIFNISMYKMFYKTMFYTISIFFKLFKKLNKIKFVKTCKNFLFLNYKAPSMYRNKKTYNKRNEFCNYALHNKWIAENLFL